MSFFQMTRNHFLSYQINSNNINECVLKVLMEKMITSLPTMASKSLIFSKIDVLAYARWC